MKLRRSNTVLHNSQITYSVGSAFYVVIFWGCFQCSTKNSKIASQDNCKSL